MLIFSLSCGKRIGSRRLTMSTALFKYSFLLKKTTVSYVTWSYSTWSIIAVLGSLATDVIVRKRIIVVSLFQRIFAKRRLLHLIGVILSINV